ncbi:MAG: hypothetical protein AAF203_06770, partial [Pseudomonadota bacterium]
MRKYMSLLLVFFFIGCSSDNVGFLSPDNGFNGGSEPAESATKSLVCADLETPDDDADPIDMKEIENQLLGDGLGGWVHSAVKDQRLFVFTWRSPKSFFVNVQLPMFSEDADVLKKMAQLRRHDRIKLKGFFAPGKAPIEHINVTELEIVQKYTGPTDDYQYDATIPEEVMKGTEMEAKVHVVANDGSVLVVEKGDRVFPVFNSNPELASCLYRNDKVSLKYKVRNFPKRPSHLEVDVSVANPVEILERIVDGHGEPLELEGSLVMFPQSPQIKFDVYAIRVQDPANLQRNFTFMSQDLTIFF